jgi:hypothetical protein
MIWFSKNRINAGIATFCLLFLVSHAAEAQLASFRFEGGAGYNNGSRDLTVSVPGVGSVNTDLLGSGGVAAEAGAWVDGLWPAFPGLSLGAQYLYFDNSGSVTSTSTGVGTIPGLSSTTSNLRLTTNALMFDAAWRPTFEVVHPYLGAGVGIAFSDLTGSALGFSVSDSQTAVAGQVFLGFDYDLTSNLYAGVTGRFFISEATYHAPVSGIPNSIDITNRPISLTAHVGLRF